MEIAIIPLYAQVWWLLSYTAWKAPGGPWSPGQHGQPCIKLLHCQQPGARGEKGAAKMSLQGAALFQLTREKQQTGKHVPAGSAWCIHLASKICPHLLKKLQWGGCRTLPVNVDMKWAAKPNSKKCVEKAISNKNHSEHIWDLAPTSISNSRDVLVFHV